MTLFFQILEKMLISSPPYAIGFFVVWFFMDTVASLLFRNK